MRRSRARSDGLRVSEHKTLTGLHCPPVERDAVTTIVIAHGYRGARVSNAEPARLLTLVARLFTLVGGGRSQDHSLLRTALALTSDNRAAEDLTQDAFLAAKSNWNRISAYDRPDLWVRRVVINLSAAMAELIDPAAPIPRIGPAPDNFVVIHSGLPEFTALSTGASVAYQRSDGDENLTVTTFTGVTISCFAHSWAYDDTEIATIGGDSGVIAQISGQPGETGAYRALWNRDHDTLIHLVANGVDRDELINLADQLLLDPAPTDATTTGLELAS